ncbi:MAG: peptidase like family protein [Ramlibacter sp.]|nr:peptidase like family protein [Ramlibacter sp.]
MLNRLSAPTLLSSLVAAAAFMTVAVPAQAEEKCSSPDANGVSQCHAGLPVESLPRLAVTQEQPQWCWAAAISMIFAHHGYHVAQQEIVKDGYGVAANFPAPSGQAMTNAMSKAWTDQHDKPFQARAWASDALGSQHQVSNDRVIAELGAGRPLLIGAQNHAVVLVGLRFERSARGNVRILGGTVIDPQPGQGIRPLLHVEMKPTYVAAVQVMPAEQKMAALDSASSSR